MPWIACSNLRITAHSALTDNEAAPMFTLQRNKIFKQTQSKKWHESLLLRLISLLENTTLEKGISPTYYS